MESPDERPVVRATQWLIDRAAILCVVQVVTCAVALPFILATVGTDSWPRRGLLFLHAVVYGCVGVLLRFVIHAEQRARTLGLFLLCIATVFAAGSIRNAQELNGTLLAPLVLVFAIKVDALTPYLAWRFATDFPHVPDSRRSQRLLTLARRFSGALSVVLIVAGLLAIPFGDTRGPLSFLTRFGPHSIYFQLQYVLAVGAFITLIARARRASLDERHRAVLLVGGIVLGPLPTMVWIILWSLSSRFAEAFPMRYAGWIIYPTLLASPIVAAYAVVARRAFGVALLFRRAVEHALSRYFVVLLLSAPAIALVLDLYRHREDRLVDALSPSSGGAALLLIAVTVLGFRGRRALLERIDRAFFRERYDARHVTAQLVEDCRWAARRDELASLLARGLDQALHVESVKLFLLNRQRGQFDDTATGPAHTLRGGSRLAGLISAADEGFDFDDSGPVPVGLMPPDVTWLTDVGARCLIPLHAADTTLLGFLSLGSKRSGLPFTREDRLLLKSVARAAELTLAYHKLFDESDRSVSPTQVGEPATRECLSCGLVLVDLVDQCPACTGTLVECLLPAIVGGNLKVAARIGGGGMGTVYRALDTDLGRLVALKTLPYVSPDAAMRLRREAHIMATLEHEAVAAVYAIQSWQGKPIIVYEFLAEGTLADRIARGPLPIPDVVSIGLSIAAGLSAIHDAGLLHGDIKPSNIGFAYNGRPKLLDFGIAAPIHTLGERADHPSHAGTLAYLAPEVARGGIATFDSEVWSLTMTLFEAVTGRQPMIGADFPETMRRVRAGHVPRVGDYLADAHPDVDRFFNSAFSRDGRRRISTATALQSALRLIQERVPIAT